MSEPAVPRPLVLVILDGFGERIETTDNAVRLAKTPALDALYASAMNLMENGWKHHPEIFVEVFKQLDTIT